MQNFPETPLRHWGIGRRRRAMEPLRQGATKSWMSGGTEASVRWKPEARRPHRWITG
jgi:hypothetical protein